MAGDRIRVTVAMDFSDALIEGLRALSPRLAIERHFPRVPTGVWAETEVLYTARELPLPEQAPRLRWVQLHMAGVNHLREQPLFGAEDVEITTASGIHATPVAEYILAMMLAFAYQLPRFQRLQARANWQEGHDFAGRELRGQTLGIVGYGSIGRELARLASALGMEVLATLRDLRHPQQVARYREPDLGDPLAEIPTRLYPRQALLSMLALCDFVALTVPLTADTHHLIDERALAAMKPGALLINVARGAIVDEAALISALAAEQIAGAALDVFEEEPLPVTSPLWALDNALLTPHISGIGARYHERAAALFAENLRRHLANQPLLNRYRRARGY